MKHHACKYLPYKKDNSYRGVIIGGGRDFRRTLQSRKGSEPYLSKYPERSFNSQVSLSVKGKDFSVAGKPDDEGLRVRIDEGALV